MASILGGGDSAEPTSPSRRGVAAGGEGSGGFVGKHRKYNELLERRKKEARNKNAHTRGNTMLSSGFISATTS
jgi:hypothetical protein